MVELKIGSLLGHGKDAVVTNIHKKNGDKVAAGELVLEVEGSKGNMAVKSQVSGSIDEIKVAVGDKVDSQTLLAVINAEQFKGSTTTISKDNKPNSFNYFQNMIKPIKQKIETDILIIGGGPGGYVAAIKAAQMGAKVVLAEKEALGGTCLNLGCIPTKALVRSAEVYRELREAEKYGCYAENISYDLKKVMDRKDSVIKELVSGIQYLMDKNKITIVKGMAEFIDKESVLVKSSTSETTIMAKNIIVATGSKSVNPPIKGIELSEVINSSEALNLKELPKKLVIIGGGVIGMEFAFIFSSFGSQVTVIEYVDDCLMNCDSDICNELYRSAKDCGIKIYTKAKVEAIIRAEDGSSIVEFKTENETKYVTADKILSAAGRAPYYEGLNIENAGIELGEKRGIKVNSHMETNVEGIYAIGDVTNIVQLAHVASHQGIVAVESIMGTSVDMDYSTVPSVIFTYPEIAMVGITEKQAEIMGIDIKVGKFPIAANGKALTYGESQGFIKLIEDKSTGRLIGGAVVGLHASDLIGEITLAVKNNLTAKHIEETIHAHPTTTEIIHEAALELRGGSIHFVK
ncbi:dihydrolipoyl dehydrogenase [Clostridium omnivorum]|uniref:Dihydrolipoyl dehydrogenase n=1 Tax=Clostridium omnivorum TaxID=1604902 RepID=A0ABQ5N8K7_9CLOT|nr:dihydrolipoyl dehydrogenase [Clostridium sp. E14]GLC31574.1 dihydrolipoyl dehydrogenase [Clostridium sp. E14]